MGQEILDIPGMASMYSPTTTPPWTAPPAPPVPLGIVVPMTQTLSPAPTPDSSGPGPWT